MLLARLQNRSSAAKEVHKGHDTFSPARKYPKSRRGPPVWPRCSALPVAEEAEHKRVQRSVGNEPLVGEAHTGHRKRLARTPQTAKEENGLDFQHPESPPFSPLESPLRDISCRDYSADYP